MPTKKEIIHQGVDKITEKIFAVKTLEDTINQLICFFEQTMHWTVKNKPFKLDIDDKYRQS